MSDKSVNAAYDRLNTATVVVSCGDAAALVALALRTLDGTTAPLAPAQRKMLAAATNRALAAIKAKLV